MGFLNSSSQAIDPFSNQHNSYTNVAQSLPPAYLTVSSTSPLNGGLVGGYQIATPTFTYPTTYSTGAVIPPPSGYIGTVTFQDANGTLWALPVDMAYMQLLSDISHYHQMSSSNGKKGYFPSTYPPTVASPSMSLGEFSEDEMETAHKVIEEMEARP